MKILKDLLDTEGLLTTHGSLIFFVFGLFWGAAYAIDTVSWAARRTLGCPTDTDADGDASSMSMWASSGLCRLGDALAVLAMVCARCVRIAGAFLCVVWACMHVGSVVRAVRAGVTSAVAQLRAAVPLGAQA